MKTKIPQFENKRDLFEYLVQNKSLLIAEKKMTVKHSEGFAYSGTFFNDKDETVKANTDLNLNSDVNEIKVRAIINTTNLMDNHYDVHLPGLWSKSLKENKTIKHLQEHEMRFDKVIADKNDLNAYAKTYSWSKLGYEYEGKTQALVFDSVVKRDRNEFMFKQYAGGHVDNHSVGMQYVKIELAVNDKDFKEEYEVWQKYYPEIVNQSFAKANGYFWAVKEAKVIEGSAVPMGSNHATPTLDNNMKGEPDELTHQQNNEPLKQALNIDKLLNSYKI
jgi:hypothetical protein